MANNISIPFHHFRKFSRLLGLLLILVLTACNGDTAQSTEPPPTPDNGATSFQTLPGSLSANGILHPYRSLALSFDTGGDIQSLDAEVGMSVQAGQTLAVLDDTDLQRAVTQATLDVENAKLQLAQLQAQAVPVPEQVVAATAAISSAQAALTQAQAQYDLRDNQAILDRAALTEAEQALRDAQNAYNNLLNDPITKDWAPYSPTAKALEDMQDHYRLVLAQYRLHSADRSYETAIASAEAQLAQAQFALYEAQHPVAPETLALADLAVKRAEQALAIAQENLARTTLVAPFDGIIAAVHVNVDEWAAPGAPVVELLDVSRWRIETKNVGELEIARVQVGQDVNVRINAFRDETLTGHVVTVSPVAVVQQGDTTYTLMIELDPTDLNLCSGMTSQVVIHTGLDSD
ncbi:MAG: HlyD family efflux transporter periplasmic adaptor subunit [Anaerolineae bacterium]|nr:HlyD family efflux transporter periplasmic adaptor subunit [Anaerolineae bacterium]